MINSFSGKYFFLSNFSEAEVWYDGDSYPTVEHAYQAAKTHDLIVRQFIRIAPTPKRAKQLGRKAQLRHDWEDIKVEIMHALVRDKFRSHPELTHRLISTGDQTLIEGNWWQDRFWGMCEGEGRNELGKILMKVREELRRDIGSSN